MGILTNQLKFIKMISRKVDLSKAENKMKMSVLIEEC